jgi:hypothetical protein
MDIGVTMFKRTVKTGRIALAATIIALALPLMSGGKEIGHDWYCPDHKGHAGYVKHLKLHLEHEAGPIADMLGEIFCDPSLTKGQKRDKTIEILNKYLSKEKVGPGVGD